MDEDIGRFLRRGEPLDETWLGRGTIVDELPQALRDNQDSHGAKGEIPIMIINTLATTTDESLARSSSVLGLVSQLLPRANPVRNYLR